MIGVRTNPKYEMRVARPNGSRRGGKPRRHGLKRRRRLRRALMAASLAIIGLLAAAIGIYLGVVTSYHH